MPSLLFTNLDGTFVDTQAKYDEVKEVVAGEVNRQFGTDYSADHVAEVLDTIDSEKYEAVGVTEDRFRNACVETMYYFAGLNDVPPSEVDVSVARERGMDPMSGYANEDLLPGSEEMLELANEAFDRVVVLSKGIYNVQRKKISELGLREFIDDDVIVDEKTPEMFREYDETPMDEVWMIGDTQGSDIEPALEAGAGAIHVPLKTWKGAKVDRELEEDDRWMRIPDMTYFEEAYDAILEWEETGDVEALKDVRY